MNGNFSALKFSSISPRQWAIRQPFPSDTDLFFFHHVVISHVIFFSLSLQIVIIITITAQMSVSRSIFFAVGISFFLFSYKSGRKRIDVRKIKIFECSKRKSGKTFSVKNWGTIEWKIFPSKKSGSCFWFHLDWLPWMDDADRLLDFPFSSSLSASIKNSSSLRGGRKKQFFAQGVFTSPDQFTRAFSITFPFHHSSRGEKKKKKKSPAHPIPPERLPIRAPMRFPFGDADDRHRSVPYPPPDCLSIFLKEHQGLLLLLFHSTFFSSRSADIGFLSRLESRFFRHPKTATEVLVRESYKRLPLKLSSPIDPEHTLRLLLDIFFSFSFSFLLLR